MVDYAKTNNPIDPESPKETDILDRVNEYWPQAEEWWNENFELGRDDQRFRNGEHWPEKVERDRKGDDRPCMIINRTENFIDQVTGDQRQNRPQIKVRPQDDESDVVVAEVMTGMIRNIEYQSRAEAVYDSAFDQSVGNGFGYWQYETRYEHPKSFNQEIGVRRIKNCFSVYFDPYAIEQDFSDARYCFVVERIPEEEFKKRFPDADMLGFDQGDKEIYNNWVNSDGVMLADYWERRPVTRMLCLLSDGKTVWKDEITDEYMEEQGLEVLKTRESTTYEVWYHKTNGFEILEKKKWAGKFIPIVPVFGKELNLDGKTVYRGLIRWAKDPIRMLDYARSTAAESLALAPKAPWVAALEQVEENMNDWAAANKSNTAVLTYKHVMNVPPPQRTLPASVATGAFTEAKAAEEDLEAVVGIYKAGLGAPSNERSGVAQRERKRESDTGTYAYIDNLSRAMNQGGRILVDLIPKIYDTKRIVRIRNLDDTERFVMINSKLDEGGAKEFGMDKAKDGAFYDLSVGKYDVVVTTGPSFATARREATEGMINFVQAVPEAGAATMDLVAEAQDWPDAEKFAKRLVKLLPPGLKEPEEGEEPEPEQPPPPPTPAEVNEARRLEIEAEKNQVEMAKLEVEKLKIAAEAEKAMAEGGDRINEIATAIVNTALNDFVEGMKGAPAQ